MVIVLLTIKQIGDTNNGQTANSHAIVIESDFYTTSEIDRSHILVQVQGNYSIILGRTRANNYEPL